MNAPENTKATPCGVASLIEWLCLPARFAPLAAVAAIATAIAAATLFTWARLIDIQRASVELSSVKSGNCIAGLVAVGHLYEGKAAGLPSVSVSDHADALNSAIRGKSCFQLVLTGLVGEVPYEDICHLIIPVPALSRVILLAS
jgi:hypothetical protein